MFKMCVEDKLVITVTTPPKTEGARAWKRMARRLGRRDLPIDGGVAWAVSTLGRAALIVGIVAGAAACGKKKTAPSAESPPSGDAVAVAPPVARFDADALARIDDEQSNGPARHRTVAEVVAEVTARIGPPTLIDPARADRHESTWAVAADGECAELRVEQGNEDALVIRDTYTRSGSPEDYAACADAAFGRWQGRRFEEAWEIATHGAPTEEAVSARLAPTLGKPILRDAKGGQVRLVWAEKTASRCEFLIATFEGGALDVRNGAADAGLPWNAECGDWHAGKPTSLWSEDVGSAALYGALTGDDKPNRVAAAGELLAEALVAARSLDGDAARAEMVRRVGPPRVDIGGADGWAVDDGKRCVYAWWRVEEDRETVHIDDATPDDSSAWLDCTSIARRDRRLAAMSNLIDWLHARHLSPRDEQAWLVDALGKPNRESIDGTDATRTWAAVSGSQCISVEQTSDGGKTTLITNLFAAADTDYADCKAAAAGLPPSAT